MAPPLRLEFPGALYHVSSRGGAREDIYRGDGDRRTFITLLAEVCERLNWWARLLPDVEPLPLADGELVRGHAATQRRLHGASTIHTDADQPHRPRRRRGERQDRTF